MSAAGTEPMTAQPFGQPDLLTAAAVT